jgi:hypothetical protein
LRERVRVRVPFEERRGGAERRKERKCPLTSILSRK